MLKKSQWDLENLYATSYLDLELDVVTSKSHTISWFPELKIDFCQFDNIEVQNAVYTCATNVDSVSAFSQNPKSTLNQQIEHRHTVTFTTSPSFH